jgi:hypothetical protein
MSVDWLGKVAVIRFGNGADHKLIEVFSYCDVPTVGGLGPSGEKVTWRADLLREATPEEAVAYWRDRALRACRTCGEHPE